MSHPAVGIKNDFVVHASIPLLALVVIIEGVMFLVQVKHILSPVRLLSQTYPEQYMHVHVHTLPAETRSFISTVIVTCYSP